MQGRKESLQDNYVDVAECLEGNPQDFIALYLPTTFGSIIDMFFSGYRLLSCYWRLSLSSECGGREPGNCENCDYCGNEAHYTKKHIHKHNYSTQYCVRPAINVRNMEPTPSLSLAMLLSGLLLGILKMFKSELNLLT